MDQVREAWDTGNNDLLAVKRLYLGVHIEVAIEASEEVVTLAEQLLHGPPPYNQNPDERRKRLIELYALCIRLSDLAEYILWIAKAARRGVDNPLETSVEEAACMIATLPDATNFLKQSSRKIAKPKEETH